MTTGKRGVLLFAGFVGTALFVAPSFVVGYTTIGGSLGIGTGGNGYQRDVRVFNNFQDVAANNNNVPDPNFPGALGAPLAIWKAAAAWNSDNPLAAKNFDFDWQGAAGGVGTANDNVNSSLGGSCGGGTLAFTETPISDGWRIRYCEEWTWSDGPGSPGSGEIDLQGVAAHELGHGLGLGHAQSSFCSGGCNNRSTMCPSYCNGVSERTIATDDANGLQAIYGAVASNKPEIASLGGSFNRGETLIINGSNFASTVNVKFTAGTTQNTGTIPGVVYNVPSTNGGTRIAVTIPAAARDGNVLVWQPSVSRLSNAFPIAINAVTPTLTSVDTNMGHLRGGDSVELRGTNFASSARVFFDGVEATVLARDETFMNVVTPPGTSEGQVADVSVNQTSGVATMTDAFTYIPNPVELTWTGSSRVGDVVTVRMSGPANSRAAAVIGLEGSFTHAGTGLTFCFGRPFDLIIRPNQMRLSSTGQASFQWNVQGEALSRHNVQGVVEMTPSEGDWVQTNCEIIQVFPP